MKEMTIADFIIYIYIYIVSTTVFGYYRIDKRNRIIDSHDVYMDPIITHSNGVWTDAPAAAIDQLKKLDIDPMAAVHAACKSLITSFNT